MKFDDALRRLQGILGSGTVVLVGSGLSCAEGLPGMGALARHLLAMVPERLTGRTDSTWLNIAHLLEADVDLETALLQAPPSPDVEQVIVRETADLVARAEAAVIGEVLGGGRVLHFSRLLRHLTPSAERELRVVTTNYDRLVELACEQVGLPVDSLFDGTLVGRAVRLDDAKRLYLEDCQLVPPRRGLKYIYRNRVALAKPHGSLDWYRSGDRAIRTPLSTGLERLIITPGSNKYFRGYEVPFDGHRERANGWIDRAASFLIIGYGFNDQHLQTHLERRLRQGAPAVLITKLLSSNATKTLADCPNVIGLVESATATDGTDLHVRGELHTFPGVRLWALDSFIRTVLEPTEA